MTNNVPHNLRQDIRNVAIIAHVDHGKTTLVDAMLRQSHIFRDNEAVPDLVMDSSDLEREKGITILAKNTAIIYRGVKINIIDTPGHADFSGEVERVLNMADGALLLVDSVEGPMPQTKYVLRKALEIGLKPILVINKIDRANARPAEVLTMTQDLFLDLATEAEQLEFPVVYAIGRQGTATVDLTKPGTDLVPLFETIVTYVPGPIVDPDGPLQMLVTTLDYDDYKGKIAIGRIFRGTLQAGSQVTRIDRKGQMSRQKINQVFTHQGLHRIEMPAMTAGDIVAVTGITDISIGETIASVENPEALPVISIEDPTLKMTFGVNTSPLGGREGKFCTSRQLRDRLYRELETNISLRVEDTDSADVFLVSGRGELHLSILIETMRREGYEFQVSRPEVITKTVESKVLEPVEHLIIDTAEEFIGPITENLARRQAQLINMHNDGKGNVRMEFTIPTRGLIGFRNNFLTLTRGNGVMSSLLLGYEPWYGKIGSSRNGALISAEEGQALTYGLNNAQERGSTFVEPGTLVYEGMIIGLNAHPSDLVVNICREKKATNVRSSTSDIAIRLTPAVKLSLEQSLDFINSDELVEVTPKNIRLRKRLLTLAERAKAAKASRDAY